MDGGLLLSTEWVSEDSERYQWLTDGFQTRASGLVTFVWTILPHYQLQHHLHWQSFQIAEEL